MKLKPKSNLFILPEPQFVPAITCKNIGYLVVIRKPNIYSYFSFLIRGRIELYMKYNIPSLLNKSLHTYKDRLLNKNKYENQT
jgi:hypothetical protein